jgi:hypothetical protein
MLEKDNFISNLAESSASAGFVRDDGKKLSIFNRISDFFQGKNTSQHFTTACKKLQEACRDGTIEKIPFEKRMEILERFNNIQKKIKNSQPECAPYLQEIEKVILKKEKLTDFSKEIFDFINRDLKSRNRKKIKSSIKKLNTVLDYYEKDTRAIGQITKAWHDSFTEGNKSFIEKK